VTQEVFVKGQSFRRIETAMQRSELSLLKKLLSGQRSLIPDGQPMVVEVGVTESKDVEKQSKDGRE
jgi:hypothetical protein